MGCTPQGEAKFRTSTTSKSMYTKNTDNRMNPGEMAGREKMAAEISGISPIKATVPPSRRRVNFQEMRGTNLRLKDEKFLKSRICELETKLRRQESETAQQRSTGNMLRTQLQEKYRHIRDLELKLPRVLADISRGIGCKETQSRRNSREMKDSMRRNHLLNVKVIKDFEVKLLEKDLAEHRLRTQADKLRTEADKLRTEADKLRTEADKQRTEADKQRTEIKDKDKIIKEHLKQQEAKTAELQQGRERKTLAEKRCTELQLENTALREKLSRIEDDYARKMGALQEENDYLFTEVSGHYDELLRTEEEMNEMEKIIITVLRGYQELKAGSLESASARRRLVYRNHRPLASRQTWPPGRQTYRNILNIKEYPDDPDTNHDVHDASPEFCHAAPDNYVHDASTELCHDAPDNYVLDASDAPDNNVHDASTEFSDEGSPLSTDDQWVLEEEYDDPPLESDTDEFDDSMERSNFYSRVEELDLKLDILLNRLNSTVTGFC